MPCSLSPNDECQPFKAIASASVEDNHLPQPQIRTRYASRKPGVSRISREIKFCLLNGTLPCVGDGPHDTFSNGKERCFLPSSLKKSFPRCWSVPILGGRAHLP